MRVDLSEASILVLSLLNLLCAAKVPLEVFTDDRLEALAISFDLLEVAASLVRLRLGPSSDLVGCETDPRRGTLCLATEFGLAPPSLGLLDRATLFASFDVPTCGAKVLGLICWLSANVDIVSDEVC